MWGMSTRFHMIINNFSCHHLGMAPPEIFLQLNRYILSHIASWSSVLPPSIFSTGWGKLGKLLGAHKSDSWPRDLHATSHSSAVIAPWSPQTFGRLNLETFFPFCTNFNVNPLYVCIFHVSNELKQQYWSSFLKAHRLESLEANHFSMSIDCKNWLPISLFQGGICR